MTPDTEGDNGCEPLFSVPRRGLFSANETMSYEDARKAFHSNTKFVCVPEKDLATWNLNYGLFYLTEAIEGDLRRMQKTLDEILDELRQRRG